MQIQALELSLPEAPQPSAVPPGIAGPGWFDSSWDLRHGLEVKEGWPADADL